MTKQDFDLVLEIGAIVIGLYLAFFKSYFQEKGKTLATLEHVEEITQKVESIKTDFIRETEKLKLDIQYNNQVKFSLKSQEINSLVDFYDKYFLWLNVILDTNFSGYDETNFQHLSNLQTSIQESYFKYLLSEAKMELFVSNEELTKHSKELKSKTLLFQNFTSLKIVEFTNLCRIFRVKMKSTSWENEVAAQEDFTQQQIKLYEEFLNGKLEKYKEIADLSVKFQNICYKAIVDASGN